MGGAELGSACPLDLGIGCSRRTMVLEWGWGTPSGLSLTGADLWEIKVVIICNPLSFAIPSGQAEVQGGSQMILQHLIQLPVSLEPDELGFQSGLSPFLAW